jgi:hypothetical protein
LNKNKISWFVAVRCFVRKGKLSEGEKVLMNENVKKDFMKKIKYKKLS